MGGPERGVRRVSVLSREIDEFRERKITPVRYGDMMMFEGGDRLEKREGMELTHREECDMMLEHVC